MFGTGGNAFVLYFLFRTGPHRVKRRSLLRVSVALNHGKEPVRNTVGEQTQIMWVVGCICKRKRTDEVS